MIRTRRGDWSEARNSATERTGIPFFPAITGKFIHLFSISIKPDDRKTVPFKIPGKVLPHDAESDNPEVILFHSVFLSSYNATFDPNMQWCNVRRLGRMIKKRRGLTNPGNLSKVTGGENPVHDEYPVQVH
jgi:hypothetical protein